MTEKRRKIVLVSILIGGVVLFGIILAFVLSNILPERELANETPQLDQNVVPTLASGDGSQEIPSTIDFGLKSQLKVVSSDPKMREEDVSPAVRIQLEFNQEVTEERLSIEVFPETAFTTEFLDTVLNIDPETVLVTGTQYEISFRDNVTEELIGVLIFTTVGERIDEYPNTGPEEEIREDFEETERITSPDVYLKNQVPYENDEFSIDSFFDENTGTFAFNATPKVDDSAIFQESLNNWLLSIGLEQDQIDELDIGIR